MDEYLHLQRQTEQSLPPPLSPALSPSCPAPGLASRGCGRAGRGSSVAVRALQPGQRGSRERGRRARRPRPPRCSQCSRPWRRPPARQSWGGGWGRPSAVRPASLASGGEAEAAALHADLQAVGRLTARVQDAAVQVAGQVAVRALAGAAAAAAQAGVLGAAGAAGGAVQHQVAQRQELAEQAGQHAVHAAVWGREGSQRAPTGSPGLDLLGSLQKHPGSDRPLGHQDRAAASPLYRCRD